MKLGMNALLQYSLASISGPTWVDVPQARDVTNSDSMQEADATTRGSGGFTMTAATLRDLSIEAELLHLPGTTAWDALYSAYKTRAVRGFRVLDATSGRGVMFDGQIFEFSRPEPLNGVLVTTIRIRPTWSATVPADVVPA
jgi:hypothetical protein